MTITDPSTTPNLDTTPVLLGTDGACSGNPGPAGWAWVASDGRFGAGGCPMGTNQIAELRAILLALQDFPNAPLTIQTDSAYSIGCCTTWKKGWQARDYRKADGKPVMNLDVIKPIHQLLDSGRPPVTFQKVKGHDLSNKWPLNTAADEQAVQAAAQSRAARADVLVHGSMTIPGS
ncbi:MAG: ribonuclease H [Nakamurella sp.]